MIQVPAYFAKNILKFFSGNAKCKLYFMKPKIEISPFIARSINKDGTNRYKFKIVNKRRRNVINLRAELHLIWSYNTPNGKGMNTKEIVLKRTEIFCLAPYNKANDALHFDFRFITYQDLDDLWEDKGGKYIRLQVIATDSFSNFTKVFIKLFHKKSFSMKEGVHFSGASLEVG